MAGIDHVLLRVPTIVSLGIDKALSIFTFELCFPCHTAIAPISQGATSLIVLGNLVVGYGRGCSQI